MGIRGEEPVANIHGFIEMTIGHCNTAFSTSLSPDKDRHVKTLEDFVHVLSGDL